MYKIIDNFLSEADCKTIKKWADSQSCSPDRQIWSPDLLNYPGVKIGKPCIGTRFSFMGGKNNHLNDGVINLRNKVMNTLNKTYDYFSYGDITEMQLGTYNFEMGDGILLHKDSSGNSVDDPNINLRYGVTLYLNEEWDNNWGGETILYSGGENTFELTNNTSNDLEPIKVIYPRYNRLLIVDGEWHKVSPNLNFEVTRKSIQFFISALFSKYFLNQTNQSNGEYK